MATEAMERICETPGKTCTGRARVCICLKQAILGVCANGRSPPTTNQIIRDLKLEFLDVYSVLFAMQLDGLIDCREAMPWTWTPTARGAALLGQRA